MAFVNVLLLFGILAVSIPIIIQLLTRRHTRRIPWGAMVFLQAAMNKRKRKVLLEDILLLACRCLLPALAALALARPFVTPGSRVPWVVVLPMILLAITLFGISFAMWRYPKWRRLSMAVSILLAALSAAAVLLERKLNLSRFGGGANKDVALIVDGSSSMSMTGSDGKTNFENAIAEAEKYIEGASRGTAFSLILGGPVPEILTPVPVSDRRVLRDTLKRMRPSQGTMRAPPALAAAAVTLAAGNNTVKQIIVAGDGQTVGWDLTSEGRWESIKALFGQLRTPPPVIWRTLPLPASIRNLAVSSVTLSREVVGADREVKVRVTVSNPGTEAVTPGGVSLAIGPKVLKAKDARQLEPGDSQTFEFPHTFEKPGAAVLTATVEAGDDLPEDDTFRLVVPVLDTLRVLVVDGDGSGSPLSRGSTYLSLALRPELAGKGVSGAAAADSAAAQAGYLLETVVEDVARAAARTDFSQFAAVALCNVPRLSDATLASLATYVRDGGGLLLLPGARTKPAPLNMWAVDGEPVLPMELGQWTSRDPAAESPPKIDTSSFSHDALRALRAGTDLGEVAPLQRWTLKPGFGGTAFQAATLTDGSPLIAIKTFGRGTVALCGLPPDPVASDLPTRRAFVPFVHELVYWLSRPMAADLNVQPSDGATLLLAPRLSSDPADGQQSGGLTARYYSQRGFKGDFVTRIDPGIEFNWGNNAPDPKVPADNFSAIWTGSVVAPADGMYVFRLGCDDRGSLRIDPVERAQRHRPDSPARRPPRAGRSADGGGLAGRHREPALDTAREEAGGEDPRVRVPSRIARGRPGEGSARRDVPRGAFPERHRHLAQDLAFALPGALRVQAHRWRELPVRARAVHRVGRDAQVQRPRGHRGEHDARDLAGAGRPAPQVRLALARDEDRGRAVDPARLGLRQGDLAALRDRGALLPRRGDRALAVDLDPAPRGPGDRRRLHQRGRDGQGLLQGRPKEDQGPVGPAVPAGPTPAARLGRERRRSARRSARAP